MLEEELRELGVTTIHGDRYARVERWSGDPPRVRCLTQARAHARVRRAPLLRRPRRQHERHRPRHARHQARPLRAARGQRELPDGPPAHLRGRRRDRVPGPRQHLDGAGPAGDAPRFPDPGAEGPRPRSCRSPSTRSRSSPTSARPRRRSSRRERTTWRAAAQYDKNPRGQISGATGGVMKLLFERPSLRLVGAHVVGNAASEIIHVAEASSATARRPTTSRSSSTTTRRSPTCTATPRSRRSPSTPVAAEAASTPRAREPPRRRSRFPADPR